VQQANYPVYATSSLFRGFLRRKIDAYSTIVSNADGRFFSDVDNGEYRCRKTDEFDGSFTGGLLKNDR